MNLHLVPCAWHPDTSVFDDSTCCLPSDDTTFLTFSCQNTISYRVGLQCCCRHVSVAAGAHKEDCFGEGQPEDDRYDEQVRSRSLPDTPGEAELHGESSSVFVDSHTFVLFV